MWALSCESYQSVVSLLTEDSSSGWWVLDCVAEASSLLAGDPSTVCWFISIMLPWMRASCTCCDLFHICIRRAPSQNSLKQQTVLNLSSPLDSKMITLFHHASKTRCEPEDLYRHPIWGRLVGCGFISASASSVFLLTLCDPRMVSKSNIKALLICSSLITLILPSFHWPPLQLCVPQGWAFSAADGQTLRGKCNFSPTPKTFRNPIINHLITNIYTCGVPIDLFSSSACLHECAWKPQPVSQRAVWEGSGYLWITPVKCLTRSDLQLSRVRSHIVVQFPYCLTGCFILKIRFSMCVLRGRGVSRREEAAPSTTSCFCDLTQIRCSCMFIKAEITWMSSGFSCWLTEFTCLCTWTDLDFLFLHYCLRSTENIDATKLRRETSWATQGGKKFDPNEFEANNEYYCPLTWSQSKHTCRTYVWCLSLTDACCCVADIMNRLCHLVNNAN